MQRPTENPAVILLTAFGIIFLGLAIFGRMEFAKLRNSIQSFEHYKSSSNYRTPAKQVPWVLVGLQATCFIAWIAGMTLSDNILKPKPAPDTETGNPDDNPGGLPGESKKEKTTPHPLLPTLRDFLTWALFLGLALCGWLFWKLEWWAWYLCTLIVSWKQITTGTSKPTLGEGLLHILFGAGLLTATTLFIFAPWLNTRLIYVLGFNASILIIVLFSKEDYYPAGLGWIRVLIVAVVLVFAIALGTWCIWTTVLSLAPH